MGLRCCLQVEEERTEMSVTTLRELGRNVIAIHVCHFNEEIRSFV